MDDEVAMADVADTFDGKVVDEPLEQSPGHVIDDEVVKGVVTGGDSGSPTVLPVGAESRLISMSP